MKKITLSFLAFMLSLCSFAQLANEGFETWPPPGWTIFDNGIGTVTWAQSPGGTALPAYNGLRAAYLDRSNVALGIPEDWLVTPAFNLPTNAQLRFWSRLTQGGNQGSIYKIYVCTNMAPGAQTDPANYTLVQTWTEAQINPTQEEYVEKLVTIPGTANTQVYVAFVMEGDNGDRWLVDDVRVVTQCLTPTTLTVSNPSLLTADLSWTSPGGATSWEIEVVAVNLPFTGVGVPYSGALPYNPVLLPDTDYKYRVRAVCTPDNKSDWSASFDFGTVALGATCAAPIVIPGNSYSTTDNTNNYSDDVDGSPGATGCGTTGTFLNGDEVFYAYTPTFNGVVSINMSGTGANAGLFVYNNCANVGVSCIAGGTGNAATPVNIPGLSVTAGTTYYIAISTSGTTQSTPYTLVIQQVNCPPPSGLSASGANATSVNLSWNANAAASWQIFVQAAGAGLPTGTGTTVTDNTNFNVTQTTPGTTFTPATAYEFYVRADCNDGSGNFSAWTGPFVFSTTQVPAAINFTETFENPPYGWTLNNGTQVNKWAIGTATNNGGANALYVSNDNGVSNTYTVSPTISVVQAYRDLQMPTSVDQVNLSFDWKGQGESTFDYLRVWVVPAGFTPAAGTQITTAADRIQIGGNYNLNPNWTTVNTVFNASAYAGQVVRLVFEWRNDTSAGTQPPAAVDNVNFSLITCPSPTALVLTGVNGDEASFSWTAPTSVSPTYDYYIAPNTTPPAAATLPTGNSTTTNATVDNLTPSVNYSFWVRSNCGTVNGVSLWLGPVSFNAPQVATTLPFNQDFEAAVSGFTLNNGTAVNKWVTGTAVSNGGTGSLYISNDNGVSNAYNTGSTSIVQAYRDIQIPAATAEVGLTFDWKSIGENNDYFRVWMVPVTFTPIAGTQITASADRVQIGGNFTNNGNWSTVNYVINTATFSNQVRRLVFEWNNNAFTGTQPPAAIDNINMSVITCPAPSALTLGTVSTTQSTFTWTAPATAPASYDYYLSTSAAAPTPATVPTGNVTNTTATVTTTSSTAYNFWVRSNCGTVNGTSFWIGPVSYNTPQVPAALNYTQDFETANSGWAVNFDSFGNKWVVGTAVDNGGTSSLYVTNDNGISNNYNGSLSAISVTHAYRDLAIPATAADVNLGFDWRAQGESIYDYIKVWMVPVTFTPVTGTMITASADRIQVGGNLNLNSNFTTVNYIFNVAAFAGTPRRLVFEWRNDTSVTNNPAGAIDNINFSVITCPQPVALTTLSVSDDQATLSWTEQGTAPDWEVYVVTAGSAAPTAASTGVAAPDVPFVATTTASGTPLAGSTDYVYYVRAVCSTSDKSFWSGPFAFKTAIGNDDCADAVVVPVNPTEACASVTPVAFTGATLSAEANNCTGTNGGDVWYEFEATNNAHGIKVQNFTGAIQPIVLALYEGDQCGSLTQIACSFNNVINATNLTVGLTYKIRVYINLATPVQTTAFNLCVNTPPPPANNNQSACVINTINPSFEEPAPVTFLYPPLINHNIVPGWRTTAADQMMEFWPFPNYQNIPAYDGVQFIELNANLVSGIYQDFATPESTEFTYSFAHRGREGVDTVQLLAGPPEGPYLPVGLPVATGNTAWSFNTGAYTSPATQTTTRFIFQSVSSASPSPSVGNFLDAITFTANNGIISANPTNLDCVNNTANVIAAGSGVWTAHGDNPTATVIADPNDNTTSISGFGVSGAYQYDWTTASCVSTLTINYDGGTIVAPVVVTDIEYCEGDVANPLQATPLTGHTLNWYTFATGGTASAVTPVPATTTVGETIYYVSQSLANGCESPRSEISVTVNEVPAAPTASGVTYCENDTATALTATALPGNTLKWYTVASGGTAQTAAPVPVLTSAGDTLYYVSQTSASGCESDRMAITVTVNPSIIPVTTFTLDVSACTLGNNPIPNPGLNMTPGGIYSAPGLTIDPQTGEITLADVTMAGTYNVTYTILPDAAVCNVGGSTTLPIVISLPATTGGGFSYTTPVCAGSANQPIQPSAGFTSGGTFTANSTDLSINNQTGEINIAASQPGSYTVTYTLLQSEQNCTAAASGSATIVISPATTAVTEFDFEDTYCFGSDNDLPAKVTGFTEGGMFTSTPAGLNINEASGEINVAASQPGTYTVTYTIDAGGTFCDLGGTHQDVVTIASGLEFTLEGNCDGNVYNVTATPKDGSYDPDMVTYKWATAQGSTAVNDSNVLDVTEFVNRSPGEDSFPLEFVLTITDNGCAFSQTITVMDIACTIQKGISPNGDGLNDNFELTSMGVRRLSIFNRYGTEVYSLSNYTNQWHGQTSGGDELPTGTYYYMIERAGENATGWIYINREE